MLLRFQPVAPVGRRWPARGAVLFTLSGALALAGCERSLPWSGEPDGAVIDESTPFLPGQPRTDAGAVAPLGSTHLDGGAEPASASSLDLPAPSQIGGLWVSCRDGFRLSGEPLRDVTRLGLMCGPINGMTPLADPSEGEVTAAGGKATHSLPARAGACYRVFAVAGEGIDDLRLQVRSSRGTRLAADELRGRVAVADPERPFCTFEDDEFEIRVTVTRGGGRYALQAWQLPSRH